MSAGSTGRSPRGLRISPRWLEWGSLVLTGVGALLWVMPTGVEVAPRAVRVPADAPAPPLRSGRDDREALVRSNLFSATRRAPSQRFVVPGQENMAPPAMADQTPTAAPSDETQLFGVLFVDGERRALLQAGGAAADGAEAVPRVVRVGDRVGVYRVRRIEADRVELTSASGTRIVRLQRRPLSDSSGVVP